EIDHTLQRRSQRRVVVIARFIWTSRWPDGRRRQARHKEIRRPKQENAYGTRLIDKLMLVVAELDLPEIGNAKRRSRDRAPKLAQRVDATLRRIAGNDRGIDGADRDSGNPIRMQISLGQRLVNTRLIGAERAAALKQQRDLFERRAPLRHGKPPVPLCCAAQAYGVCATARKPSLTLAVASTEGSVAEAFCRRTFAGRGLWLYVTNVELDLRSIGITQS